MTEKQEEQFIDAFTTLLEHYMKALSCNATLKEFVVWGFDTDDNDRSMVNSWNRKHGDKFFMNQESNAFDDLPQMIMLYKKEHE